MSKIVIFTGAGVSAESGISTFRDSDGLWEKYDIKEKKPNLVHKIVANWRVNFLIKFLD
jgi:NAD-dependent SIR2 family protein deacetylase